MLPIYYSQSPYQKSQHVFVMLVCYFAKTVNIQFVSFFTATGKRSFRLLRLRNSIFSDTGFRNFVITILSLWMKNRLARSDTHRMAAVALIQPENWSMQYCCPLSTAGESEIFSASMIIDRNRIAALPSNNGLTVSTVERKTTGNYTTRNSLSNCHSACRAANGRTNRARPGTEAVFGQHPVLALIVRSGQLCWNTPRAETGVLPQPIPADTPTMHSSILKQY